MRKIVIFGLRTTRQEDELSTMNLNLTEGCLRAKKMPLLEKLRFFGVVLFPSQEIFVIVSPESCIFY